MQAKLICAGFHRSGTSLASQIIHLAGVPYAIESMYGNISNPDGHFEDVKAMELHDQLLTSAGTNWQFHGEVSLIGRSDQINERFRQYIASRDKLHGEAWIMKDPRSTLFLDAWHECLNEKGMFVLLFRHWGSCIQSLLKRHSEDLVLDMPSGSVLQTHMNFWVNPELAARMWLEYNRKLIAFVEKNPSRCLLVSQHQLLDGLPLIQLVNHKFDISLPETLPSPVNASYTQETVYREIVDHLSPELVEELESVLQRLIALSSDPGQSIQPRILAKPSEDVLRGILASELLRSDGSTGLVSAKRKPNVDVPENIIGTLGSFNEITSWLSKYFDKCWDLDRTGRLIKTLPEIEPYKALSYEWLGRLYEKHHQYDSAEHCYLKAISMADSKPYHKLLLSNLYIVQFDFDGAYYYLESAYNQNPNNAVFSYRLGYVSGLLQRLEQSKIWYERSLKVHDTVWTRLKLSEIEFELAGLESACQVLGREKLGKPWSHRESNQLNKKIVSLKLQSKDPSAKDAYQTYFLANLNAERFKRFISDVTAMALTRSQAEWLTHWLILTLSKFVGIHQIKSLVNATHLLTHEESIIESTNNMTSMINYSPLLMDTVLDSIQKSEPFCHIKLCHGFWEQVVRISKEASKLGVDISAESDESRKIVESFTPNWPSALFFEVMTMLRDPAPGIYKMLSPYGWKGGLEVEGTPLMGINETQGAILSAVNGESVFDGLFWKDSVATGTFAKFLSTIKHANVIVVCPQYAQSFIAFSGLKNAKFIEVHPTKAAWSLDEIEQEIASSLVEYGQSIVLIEAGGVTSAVLASRLFKKYSDHTFITLGQVLNIGNLQRFTSTNWFHSDRKRLTEEVYRIARQNKEGFSFDRGFKIVQQGVDARLRTRINQRIKSSEASAKAIRFVERKSINHELVEDLLSLSSNSNHWANFGPVTELLEETVVDMLELNSRYTAVATKSGTSAIQALVGLEEIKAGKRLKWVVSSFGFFSTYIGSLADALVVDCNEQGFLDESCLSALEHNDWDGVVVTNTFGLFNDEIEKLAGYCSRNGKRLVVDNAVGLMSGSALPLPNQAFSFHHTKPWGFGEGGCVIIDKQDDDAIRSLINFNFSGLQNANRHASNGKLSDVEAAHILQRLATRDAWTRRYSMQMRRLQKLAVKAGLSLLAAPAPTAVLSSLAVLSNRDVPQSELVDCIVPIRKYYRPFVDQCDNAKRLYSRILNISCNPELCQLTDEEILGALIKLNGQ